jgi:hypothetical protein
MRLDRDELQASLIDFAQKLNRYKVLIIIVLVVSIYGFLIWRIDSLNNVQPSSDAVTAQVNPLRTAHIDKQTISQLESLRDNSVNVQSLFDQARNNPFQ